MFLMFPPQTFDVTLTLVRTSFILGLVCFERLSCCLVCRSSGWSSAWFSAAASGSPGTSCKPDKPPSLTGVTLVSQPLGPSGLWGRGAPAAPPLCYIPGSLGGFNFYRHSSKILLFRNEAKPSRFSRWRIKDPPPPPPPADVPVFVDF